MGWCQLVLDLAITEELLDFLGTLIIQAMKAWSASSSSEGVMDVLDSGSQDICCSIRDRPQQDDVTIEVICHH
jgi:hypothetical protein